MANRIAISSLNASTVDIINTIRANANYEYQSLVPEIETATEIPKVGEVLFGYPALANQFINSLITRIAQVNIKSALFNNAYSMLKKGYLEFGETVEEVFVQIAKAREFSVDKAQAREFKRTLPDVRTAFHSMNWRVQYPITVQDEDLRTAFLSAEGIRDLIAKIVDSLRGGAEYDEFLLFKYLLIKAIAHGKMKAVSAGSTDTEAAVAFRSMANKLTFMSTEYNASGVTTITPREDQYIFMDADFNASFDVNVLASAFNMDKADFIGKLHLIDNWNTFDNKRFEEIRKNSDMIEEVTAEELALLDNVKAVIVDGEWFQIYDNLFRITECYVSSGLYWNYNLNVWKTVSSSPFSNAVVFVSEGADISAPASITVEITGKDISEVATVLTLEAQDDNASFKNTNVSYVQTQALTENGIAVHKYGAVIIPSDKTATEITVVATVGDNTYTATTSISSAQEVGSTITLNKN